VADKRFSAMRVESPGIALEDGHSVRGIYVTLAVNAKPLHILITLSRTPTVQLTVRGRGAGAAGEPTAGHDCGQYKC